MSVPDESYSKNATCALNSTSTLFSLAYCGSLIDHILCNTSEKLTNPVSLRLELMTILKLFVHSNNDN